MRLAFLIIIGLLISLSVTSSTDYAPEVKNEFHKFFGESLPEVIQAKQVDLIVEKTQEMPDQIPIKMQFNVSGVDKVLLLKVPSNGYSNEGQYFESCKNEPVYIAGFNFKKNTNVTELETRLKTSCVAHQVILMMWVKTDSGYQLDTTTFQTTSESPGM